MYIIMYEGPKWQGYLEIYKILRIFSKKRKSKILGGPSPPCPSSSSATGSAHVHGMCGMPRASPSTTKVYTTGTSLTYYGIPFSCNTLARMCLSLSSLLHGVYGIAETKHDMVLQGSPPMRSYTKLAPLLKTSKQPTSSALNSRAHQMLIGSRPHTRGSRLTLTHHSSTISEQWASVLSSVTMREQSLPP